MSRERRLWHTPTRSDTHPSWERRMNNGIGVRKSPIPNLAAEAWMGQPYSTLSLEVSPASLIRLQESVKGLVISVTSGRSSGASLARLNPDGSWLRMYQDCYQAMLDGSLEEYCQTWPRWGTMLDGVLTELSTWERGTGETGCSLWPTPSSQLAGEGELLEKAETVNGQKPQRNQRVYNPDTGKHIQVTLNRAVRLWPTPNSFDALDSRTIKGAEHMKSWIGAPCLTEVIGKIEGQNTGALNPEWVTWLMGFPPGWLNLTSPESQQESRTG